MNKEKGKLGADMREYNHVKYVIILSSKRKRRALKNINNINIDWTHPQFIIIIIDSTLPRLTENETEEAPAAADKQI